MMDFPRLQLHTEDDSQQSACDVRNGHSADEYKPAHLYCLLVLLKSAGSRPCWNRCSLFSLLDG
ncbi:hypothetical protein DPMN_134034 [Dreissena polymorpha]|uniref:Uncharacterized protein n=1 Tax=Dreissena polymorpha TaxID=45954 RepID=A0A9D4G1B0_DREPO|nr:hypothetical protein DPMN_134034 [Dreissena polymorpha]